ncbi:MAG: hypothetical protein LBC62_02360 [Treponema sp.]|jgi:Na+-transporting methylmalonyl-CoA/oxaloacetate decarboxylase gamma subunit|nr:hypothetical protein [Treponema sp.]
MDRLLQNLVQNASTLEKGVFLMVFGILFVFIVQTIFYLAVKLWPRKKTRK